MPEGISAEIPQEWLKRLAEKLLTKEEQAEIEAIGGFDKLMETLRQRLAEQKGRHQGGLQMDRHGWHLAVRCLRLQPEGVRIGQDESRHRRAVKVWDKREFRDLDDTLELGTRNMKIALRRLRRFARSGAQTELDLHGTIRATAANAGSLDLKMQAERRNTVRVLLFLDIGGSMDDHVRVSAELFSAARSEFKHLQFFYFHNCPYERLWTDNSRRAETSVATAEVMRTYGPEYRAIFVGDATMSPYEIAMAGGSVEHWNEEAGSVWLNRMTSHWRRTAWLNPAPQHDWGYTQSIAMVRQLIEGRMYPLTVAGLDGMARELTR